MSSGPGLGGYPDIQPPPTRGPQAWKHLMRVLFETVPKEVKRSQRARERLRTRRR